MSKDQGDFKAPETDYIENVNSSSFIEDVNQRDEDAVPFVFTLNHALTIIVLYAGYLSDIFISDLSYAMFSTIDAEIGPSPNNFYWLLSGPTLAAAIAAPVFGKASDIFGRKYIQLIASVFGIIGSAITAKTDSMGVAIGCSVLIGISLAGHQLALTSIVEILPRKYRAMTIGLFLGALLPAAGFASLIGAALTLHSTWRVIYWLALALYFFSFFGTFLFYHPEPLAPQINESLGKRLIHFDYLGGCLWAGGITTLAVGLLFGGTVYPWISVGVFVPAFIGIAVLVAFFVWLIFNRSRYPILPRSLTSGQIGLEFKLILATIFFIGMVCSTTNGMWPTQVKILYAQKEMPIALYTTPYGLAGCLFAPVAGFLFFPKQARWILVGYTTVLFVVVSAQAIVDKDTSTGSTVLVAFTGAMHTATIVMTTAMVQLTVHHEDLGLATNSAFSFFTFGGVAYGIIDQVMVKNELKPQIIKLVVPALAKAGVPLLDLAKAVPAFMNGDLSLPAFAHASPLGLLAAFEAMKEAYVHVFRFVYLVSILFGALAVIMSLLTKNVDAPVTSRIDARLKSRSFSGLIPARKSEV